MNKRYHFLCVNQTTGPLFIDILNAFAKTNNDISLFVGAIEPTYATLSEKISVSHSKSYKKTSMLSRILSWSIFSIHLFFHLLCLKNKKNTKLFLVSNPPFNPFLGLLCKRLFKIPYSVLIYDIYPDIIINHGYLKNTSFIIKIWKKCNRIMFNESDEIVTISKGMKSIIQSYTPSNKVHVVDCWANTDFITPMPKSKNKFAKKYNQENKLTVLYSGNFGLSHPLERIIECANILKNNHNIHFLFIGDGTKKKTLLSLISKYKLQNVTVLPFQEPGTIPFSMTTGDIAIVTVDKQSSSLLVPSKLYYMMAAGCCILCISEPDSEIAQLEKSFKIGHTISETDIEKMKDFILDMHNNKEKLETFKKNTREASHQFTPKNAERFVSILTLDQKK